MSLHIIGSEAAILVKSLNPEAENLITSFFKSASRSEAVPTMVYAIKCGKCEVMARILSWYSALTVSTIEPKFSKK